MAKKFDGETFPWVESLDGTWHIRPRTDRWTKERTTQASTICGLRVKSNHVADVAPSSVSDMCHACRRVNWVRPKPVVRDAPGFA